jgi:hypothetical protein
VGFSYFAAGWVCVVFLGHAMFYEPDYEMLPNGYAIRLDEDDANLLLNPAAQANGRYGTAEGADTATDVSRLQLAGRYMFGAADHLGSQTRNETDPNGIFFRLDTQTAVYRTFRDEAALRAGAQAVGVPLALESLNAVRFRYLFDATAWVFIALALLPPLAGSLIGLGWIFRLRRRAARAGA